MTHIPVNQGEGALSVPGQAAIERGFQEALQVVDDIVLKNYLARLEDLEIVPLDQATLLENLSDNVRFFKINQMVYEKNEFSTYKFASVFNALSTLNCAVFVVIDSDGQKTDFYMGIRSLCSDRTTDSLKETLEKSMKGQFPGIKTTALFDTDMQEMLDRVDVRSISAVSCVANIKDHQIRDNQSFVQGLEKLAFAMQGSKYTALILANGATQAQLSAIRQSYESIYTQLVPFAKSQVQYSSNRAISLSQASTTGSSVSDTQSTSYGSSTTTGTGRTSSSSQGTSAPSTASKAVSGLAAVSSILSAALAVPTGGGSLVVGGLLSSGLGMLGTAVNRTDSRTEQHGTSYQESRSQQVGGGHAHMDQRSQSETQTQGSTSGTGQAVTVNLENKTISTILERLDIQLKRLQEFESLGMWECAAYFLSDADNPFAAEIAASTYKAIMRGENSGVEVSAINSWGPYDGNKVEKLSQYIKHFVHPTFVYRNARQTIQVTPCCLVSGNELALHMGLPRKSVCGFPVIEHADFGKEVSYADGCTDGAAVNLGNIHHMGSDYTERVRLDLRRFAMHTFITGATGSGKSNTVYELLRQLNSYGVTFLVVEPAKGEYKNVFGTRPDVLVLGTNPACARLLQINPFRFPAGIHVLEHVDRLIEIFNVCWPMYAAMPAVLKEALLQAYQVCGWDLVTSVNAISQDLFPTFQDLQEELVDVIEGSAYAQEVKSNYMGSLVTRVKSLTNGLNGQIFSPHELDSALLFDTNVIIDLSRVGSLETKSLLMGILVMRLNEHRMVTTQGMNVPLKHITVLEEAHHILRRTSGEQNPDSPSVTGKSVEMLSNAIAEMRTYGEGFLIADQSPSAVDLSAIRNTNTKIIMRLPDEIDRRLAGKSAGLKEEQLDEISKLPRGVAVVYQNDWIEPVLCKISKYPGNEVPYQYSPAPGSGRGSDQEGAFYGELLKLLLHERLPKPPQIRLERLYDALPTVEMSARNKLEVVQLLHEYHARGKLALWEESRYGELSGLVVELTGGRAKMEGLVQRCTSFEEWNRDFSQLLRERAPHASDELTLAAAQCFMKAFSVEHPESSAIYGAWRQNLM